MMGYARCYRAPVNRRSGAVLFLAMLLALGACGGGDEPTKTATTSPTPTETSASPSPSEAASEEWVELSDESGVAFSLPTEVRPAETTKPFPGGKPVDFRLYQVEAGELGYSVTIGAGRDFRQYNARLVYQGMERALAQAGAKEVALSDVRSFPAQDAEGLGATLSFRATDGSTNYWRMATFGTDKVLVQVQVLIFADELSKDTRGTVDSQFNELVESIVFP